MASKAVGAGMGAISGAGSGAMIGTSIMPGAGTAIGAGVGAIAGGAMGYLDSGNSDGPSLPWDQYNQRLAEITDYQTQLNGAQSSWAAAIGNYNTTMMNLATPTIEARYAAHGMNFSSGAVAAEVARQAAMYTAEGTTAIAKQNLTNINNVDAARGSAWSSMFGLAGRNSQLGWGNNNDVTSAQGQNLWRSASLLPDIIKANKTSPQTVGTTNGDGSLPGSMAYTGSVNPFSDPMGMRSEATPQFRLLGS